MPTKTLYSLSDDNPDLQKQIGCMNGIFHIFDRHHFLSSRRFANHNQKRLPPGENDKHETKPHSASERPKDKNLKKTDKEKKRTSTESSITSFSSSSCSSSFSSQPEPSLYGQVNLPGTPNRDLPVYQPSGSPQLGRQYVDLRHIVKDSMYREARQLPIKENVGGQILKYMDSPRPVHLQRLKTVKSRDSGLNQSFQVLPPRKDGFMPRDAPRFSYDGRDSLDAFKSAMKVKEPPRLSLDSRVRSMRGSNIHILGDQRGFGKPNNNLDQQQEPGSYKTPSSVVAKLMGLGAFPEPTLANGNQPGQMKTFSNVECDSSEIKQNRISGSPGNSRMEGISPRNADSVKKPLASSKFPLETAPWRQPDGNKGQTPASKSRETPTKPPNSCASIYGEIEKRLAQLEFNKSGKDLRALKQILEAMQKTKEMSQSRKDHTSKVATQTGNYQRSNLDVKGSNPSSTTFKGATTPKCFKSPTAIMKAAKTIEKASNSISLATVNRKEFANKLTAKDTTPEPIQLRESSSRLLHLKNKHNNAEAPRLAQISKSPQKKKSAKCSEPMNPRLQQKKQSHPTTPSSDLSRARRHVAKSGSPHRKSPDLQQRGTRLYGINNDARDLGHQDDATSLKSESNISMVSCIDSEVTSADRPDKNPETWYTKDRSTEEPARVGGEQPSPVSVLDATFYRDEPPSPVKKISPVFKDEDTLNSDEAEWSLRDLNHSSSFSSDNDYRKQNLMHLYPVHQNEIAFINNSMEPDHRYISEILLASGLLRDVESDFTSFQLHPSGHMINPNLFLVLEQNKSSTRILDAEHKDKKTIHSEIRIEKAQRKLIFNAVNEILVKKLSSWVSSSKLIGKVPRRQELLKNLCTEVDRLQANNSNCSLDDEEDGLRSIIWEDLMHESMDWTSCQSEFSWLALYVERLIFKDLITELVRDESAGRLCRQLFSK